MDTLDMMFVMYLDEALAEFEKPHQKTEAERLDVYREAFRKVVMAEIHKKMDESRDLALGHCRKFKDLLHRCGMRLSAGQNIEPHTDLDDEIRELLSKE